jgi:hypothetical protein
VKHIRLLALIICFVIPAYSESAETTSAGFAIKQLDVHIDILIDGTLLVTEKYLIDFYQLYHGFFRFIPLKGEWRTFINGSDINFPWSLKISDVESTDNIKKYIYMDTLYIRLISLKHENYGNEKEFTLTYRVQGAINFENDNYDELIWSLFGDKWPVWIDKVNMTVALPPVQTASTIEKQVILYIEDKKIKETKGSLIGNELAYHHAIPVQPFGKILLFIKWKKGIIQSE